MRTHKINNLYYVEMLSWDVAGNEIWPTLSRQPDGTVGFKQSFERAWDAIEFKTPQEALRYVRTMLPDKQLCLNEERSRILTIEGDEACMLYRISREEFDL